MTDREKLIELLEEAIKERCLKIRCIDCNYHNAEPYPCRNELVADFLISHGVTVQQWIPASEPPKVRGEYIVMIKGAEKATTLWYYPNRKTWEDEDYSTPYPVTHWMPLPEPPEEE